MSVGFAAWNGGLTTGARLACLAEGLGGGDQVRYVQHRPINGVHKWGVDGDLYTAQESAAQLAPHFRFGMEAA